MQFSDLSCLSRRFVGKIQTAENVRISVKTDIEQVLSVGVDNYVNSYESSRGEASFYGKTNVKFLYSDGTTVNGQSFNADFTASISDDMLEPDSKLTFDVVASEVKTETNANTATVTVLLEISVYAYVTESVPFLCASEDAFCKVESVEYLQSAHLMDLPLVLDEELNATRTISSVLLAESSVTATDYTLSEGVLNLSGEACVRLTYVSEGNIVTDVLPFKFTRELDASQIDSDSQLRLDVVVKNTKVRLNITEQEVNSLFSVEIAVNVRAEAVKIGQCEYVDDAYTANSDFLFERKSVTTTLPCGSTVADKRVTASLPITSGKTPLTAVNLSAVVTRCASQERRAEVQGVVYATVLYSTDTGTESENVELPFSETIPVDYLMPQCASFAKVAVTNFTVKEAGTLQAEADLRFVLESERDVVCNVIAAAEEQPFDKSSLPAIEVCLAHKGETLWQLCKNLHMSEENLLAANPEITNPLESDAKIVVFNRI